jgi:hypothetical protein
MSITTAPAAQPATATQQTTPAPREWNPIAGLLSYLVPGLGQISQGRISKGVLFFVCVYTLFFYGTALGSGTAIDTSGSKPVTYTITSNVYLPDTAGKSERNNPLGLPRPLANLYNKPQFAAQFWVGIAAWPAIWQYWNYENGDKEAGDPIFGHYQRTPSDEAINAVQNQGERQMELGWVFTVIAGVLNILVIYDALAGPAFLPVPVQAKTS